MDLPQVDSCLFGLLPLKTGTIIAGIVTLFVEVSTQGYSAWDYRGESWVRTLLAILTLLGVISSVLVIIGVLVNNKQLVQIYVIVFTILIIVVIILLILNLLGRYGAADHTSYIVNTIIFILVVGYCLVVANSYYNTM